MATEEESTMGELRSLLHQPGPESFMAMLQLLQGWEDPESLLQLALPYCQEHLRSWPEEARDHGFWEDWQLHEQMSDLSTGALCAMHGSDPELALRSQPLLSLLTEISAVGICGPFLENNWIDAQMVFCTHTLGLYGTRWNPGPPPDGLWGWLGRQRWPRLQRFQLGALAASSTEIAAFLVEQPSLQHLCVESMDMCWRTEDYEALLDGLEPGQLRGLSVDGPPEGYFDDLDIFGDDFVRQILAMPACSELTSLRLVEVGLTDGTIITEAPCGQTLEAVELGDRGMEDEGYGQVQVHIQRRIEDFEVYVECIE